MLATTKLTLKSNFIWTLIGNLFYSASQWVILILLAKLTTPQEVGLFSLGLALITPLYMLTNLQLRSVLATDAQKQHAFSTYLSLRYITISLTYFIFLVFLLFRGDSWQTYLFLLTLGAAKMIESISDLFYGYMQQQERMDYIAISMIGKALGGMIIVAVLLFFSSNLTLAMAGLGGVWLLGLLMYDIPITVFLGGSYYPVFQGSKLKFLLNQTLSLGVVMMVVSLNSNIPRYFIEYYLNQELLGYFSAVSYLMVVGNTIINALGQALMVRLAQLYAQKQYLAFQKLLLQTLILSLSLGILGIMVAIGGGKLLLTWLYRPEYATYTPLFIWLMVVAAVNYLNSFLGYGMTAARYFKAQMPLFMVVASVLSGISWWAVPEYGLMGAVYAMLTAAVIQTIGSLLINWHAIYRNRDE